MTTKIDYFKRKLEEEREQLEKKLSSIARRNPEDPSSWEPAFPKMDTMVSDATEVADATEEFETQIGIGTNLGEKLNQVKAALDRIEDGAYGKCAVDGRPIEEERLEANPTATTCIEHSSKV